MRKVLKVSMFVALLAMPMTILPAANAGDTAQITVTILGSGKGLVQNADDSIFCHNAPNTGYASDCSESYAMGTTGVVLQAVPLLRSTRFAGWSGDAAPCGKAKLCYAPALNRDYNVTAKFRRKR